MLIYLLIILIIIGTLTAGWRQGGMRAGLQFAFWLPLFWMTLYIFYELLAGKSFPPELVISTLKKIGLVYAFISASIWLLDRTLFRPMLRDAHRFNQKKLMRDKMLGVAIAAFKIVLVVISLSAFGVLTNQGKAPDWMRSNAILAAPLPLVDYGITKLIYAGHLSFEHVYYDNESQATPMDIVKQKMGKNFSENPYLKMQMPK